MRKRLQKRCRKPRKTSVSLCRHCYSYGCDPGAMSFKFDRMIREREEAGVCVACGNNPCICKSSELETAKQICLTCGRYRKECVCRERGWQPKYSMER